MARESLLWRTRWVEAQKCASKPALRGSLSQRGTSSCSSLFAVTGLADWYLGSRTGNEVCPNHAVLPGVSSDVANRRQRGVQAPHIPASVPRESRCTQDASFLIEGSTET